MAAVFLTTKPSFAYPFFSRQNWSGNLPFCGARFSRRQRALPLRALHSHSLENRQGAPGVRAGTRGVPLHGGRLPSVTGEVTITGQVLPIGGLKEKLLAAHRAGIKKVLIPFDNQKDLVEIPEIIKKSIEIVSVKTVDEVLKHALTKELKPVKWVEIDQVSNKNKDKSEVTSAH